MSVHPSSGALLAPHPTIGLDSFSSMSPLASFRADMAMLVRFAELYQVPQALIQAMTAEYARRKQRILPAEAMEMMQALGLKTQLFRGDLKDVQETGRPVIAIMTGQVYLLVLMVERRVVVAQAGQTLAPVTMRRADFTKNWTQGWLANA